jgi:ATP-dependent Lon protease
VNFLERKESNFYEIPMLPLRGVLVFPYMIVHLDVGREKSINAIDQAMLDKKEIFLAMQKEAQTDEPDETDIYQVGTVAEIRQLLKLPGGTIRVLVEGLYRAKIEKYLSYDPYLKVSVSKAEDEIKKNDPETEALMRNLVSQFEQYAKERKQFGKPLAKFQAIQFMLAEMETKLNAAKLLVYHAAKMLDQGKHCTKEAAMAKYFASESAIDIVSKALQIHGGYGYIKDYPIERMYRDVRVLSIYEGTTQVQQMVISGILLK